MEERYEIRGKIGQGGLGSVYRAYDKSLKREVALKRIATNDDAKHEDEAVRQMTQETGALAALQNPHIVTIYDVGSDDDGPFVVMELLKGETLDEIVEKAPLTYEDFREFVLQVQEGLIAAQDLGLVHRDIKPSNIMLTMRGGVCDTVKILDFGLVKDLSGDDSVEDDEDMIAGTPMYLAPETILSARSGSPQSDLYALGAVAYYMLCGRPVFDTGEVEVILTRQLEAMPPFPSQRLGAPLPESLEYVVMSCLAKDPADRPASAAKLAELLRACDVEPWTEGDAAAWWAGFAEALRAQATSGASTASSIASGVEVVVSDTRS